MADIYKPGQKVPYSGIYQVVHDLVHQERHEVTCISGEVFPPCNKCGGHPRFELVRAAVHIRSHQHFK